MHNKAIKILLAMLTAAIIFQKLLYSQANLAPYEGIQGEWKTFIYPVRQDGQQVPSSCRLIVLSCSLSYNSPDIYCRVEWQVTNTTAQPKIFSWESNWLTYDALGSWDCSPPINGKKSSLLQPQETSATLWSEYRLSKKWYAHTGFGQYLYWGIVDEYNKFHFWVKLKPLISSDMPNFSKDYLQCTPTSARHSQEKGWATFAYETLKNKKWEVSQCKVRIVKSAYREAGTQVLVSVLWQVTNLSAKPVQYSWENKHLYLPGRETSAQASNLQKQQEALINQKFPISEEDGIFVDDEQTEKPIRGLNGQWLQPQETSAPFWVEYSIAAEKVTKKSMNWVAKDILSTTTEIRMIDVWWGMFSRSQNKFNYLILLQPDKMAAAEEQHEN